MITDRKDSDVLYAQELKDKWKNRTITDLEKALYLAHMKGAYDYTDYTRVNNKVQELRNILDNLGYSAIINIETYVETTILNVTNQATYLANIDSLKNAYFVKSTTPALPTDMQDLTYTEANNIEKILVDVEDICNAMQNYFIHCGVARCGQSRFWQNRFRRVI